MTRGALAIGCAAGFGGDRTDAAGPVVDTLVARGGPGVLVFEMLAERTLALAQLERRANPNCGHAPLLEPMVRPILRRCIDHGIPIVSNFGAANPYAATVLRPAVIGRATGNGMIEIVTAFEHLRRRITAEPLTKHLQQPVTQHIGLEDAAIEQDVRRPHRLVGALTVGP